MPFGWESSKNIQFQTSRSLWDDGMRIGKAAKKVPWVADFIYMLMKFSVSRKREIS
jgi:hypothetical protein